MAGNWPKAIQYTATTLLAIIAGWVASYAINSLWPVVVVVLACSTIMGQLIFGNMILEWRNSRIERQTRSVRTL